MSIEQALDDAFKAAMRSRDKARISCIRQVKAKVQEAENAPGFTGERTDALWQDIIGKYCKSLDKSSQELRGQNERGDVLAASYDAEVSYLRQFLPARMDEAQTRKLIADTIATMGITDPRQGGKVLGALMKEHRATLDPTLAKTLVTEMLQAAPASP